MKQMPMGAARSDTRSPRYPTPKTRRKLYLIGSDHRRVSLPRLTFGRFKIPMTQAELTELSRVAEVYLSNTGTLFGFARHLVTKCSS